MNLIGAALVIVSIALPGTLACDYDIKDFKVVPCDKKPEGFTPKDIMLSMNDDCSVQISGCIKFLKAYKEIAVNCVAMKNGIKAMNTNRKACNADLFGTILKCPVAENSDLCAGPTWKVDDLKNAMSMALGKIDVTCNVITDLGNFCYKGSAKISKK